MISFILVPLLLTQICLGRQTEGLQNQLEENILKTHKDLIDPILNGQTQLNETIINIEQDLAHKKSINKFILSEYLKLKAIELNLIDKCQNLSDYLPKVQETVERIFYLSTDVSGALSGLFIDGLNCFNINVFRAIACWVSEVRELKDIYEKFKPEIDPMIAEIKDMALTLAKLVEDCIQEI